MSQNLTREIIAIIEKIITKQDKNGKDYLILEIDSNNPILVFDGKVSSTSWYLKKPSKPNLTVRLKSLPVKSKK